jgi:pyroglutamyl-peptidase
MVFRTGGMNSAADRILVAGFVPNDDGLNASQAVVESLKSEPPAALKPLGDRLRYAILPGDTHVLTDALVALIEEHDPAACVLVGQAPGRSKITFERIATNLRDFMVPDRAGNLEAGSRILAGAPAAYFSTVDALQLARTLESAGIPAAPSNHAGNHLCNQALFAALHHAATARPHMRVVFMHVPLLPSQVRARWTDSPTMPLAVLRDALTRTVCHVLDPQLVPSGMS